jgi:TetR/AcrR family transcriptional repressor of nem operon
LEWLREKMTACSLAEVITGFFQDTIRRSIGDALPRGCMLVNSALDASPEDLELLCAIAQGSELIEDFFPHSYKAWRCSSRTRSLERGRF